MAGRSWERSFLCEKFTSFVVKEQMHFTFSEKASNQKLSLCPTMTLGGDNNWNSSNSDFLFQIRHSLFWKRHCSKGFTPHLTLDTSSNVLDQFYCPLVYETKLNISKINFFSFFLFAAPQSPLPGPQPESRPRPRRPPLPGRLPLPWRRARLSRAARADAPERPPSGLAQRPHLGHEEQLR